MRWLKYFRLGIGASQATVSGYRRPMGYQQLTPTGTAANLTVPKVANTGLLAGYAVIQCEGTTAGARWRDDGTAPTSTVGMILSTGQELDYSGDLTMIQFIVQTGSPILNISYYA